jgi:cytochrome P450
LNALGPAMTDTTDEALVRWRELAQRGEPIDIQTEMMHMILAILTRTLFGADMSGDAAAVEQSVATQAKYLNDRLNSPVDIPERAPLPVQRRFLAARATLNRVVDDVIADRRRTGVDTGDLLSILLEARDEETGEPISDEQARDEIKTLLIAGHETTATTLGWTFYLLSKHPEVTEQLRAELDEVLGDRAPTAEDVPNLKYTTMVLYESLRLYPPLWIVSRMPIEDDEIAGYPVKAGTSVIICSYVTHRHPEFWDNPEGFEPERHTPERMKERHRYAYIPFGGGPRGCIGFPFAIMEMPLVLARVLQQFRVNLVPGFEVEPESAISLRQKRGALMHIEPL